MEEKDVARVSAKGRIVIPRSVLRQLGLKQGDLLRFYTSGDRVTIEKVRDPEDDPFAAFPEWNSAEDDNLYRNL